MKDKIKKFFTIALTGLMVVIPAAYITSQSAFAENFSYKADGGTYVWVDSYTKTDYNKPVYGCNPGQKERIYHEAEYTISKPAEYETHFYTHGQVDPDLSSWEMGEGYISYPKNEIPEEIANQLEGYAYTLVTSFAEKTITKDAYYEEIILSQPSYYISGYETTTVPGHYEFIPDSNDSNTDSGSTDSSSSSGSNSDSNTSGGNSGGGNTNSGNSSGGNVSGGNSGGNTSGGNTSGGNSGTAGNNTSGGNTSDSNTNGDNTNGGNSSNNTSGGNTSGDNANNGTHVYSNGHVDESKAEYERSGQSNCTWYNIDGRSYWYENGIKQGTYDDSHGVIGDGSVRGREIYDPESDGWYWLDSVLDGAKAVGKEVWIPYIYQQEREWDDARLREVANESDAGMADLVYTFMKEKKGKWVRYDENGRMLKGWVTISGALASKYPDQVGNTYYYDTRTGLMAKGWVTINGKVYYFDEVTGMLR